MIVIILLLHEHIWISVAHSNPYYDLRLVSSVFRWFYFTSLMYNCILYIVCQCDAVRCGAVRMCILFLYDIHLIVEWANEHWACRRIHLLSIYRQISFILFYWRVCKKSLYRLMGIKRQNLNWWMLLARKYVINFETPSVIAIFYTYSSYTSRRP